MLPSLPARKSSMPGRAFPTPNTSSIQSAKLPASKKAFTGSQTAPRTCFAGQNSGRAKYSGYRAEWALKVRWAASAFPSGTGHSIPAGRANPPAPPPSTGSAHSGPVRQVPTSILPRAAAGEAPAWPWKKNSPSKAPAPDGRSPQPPRQTRVPARRRLPGNASLYPKIVCTLLCPGCQGGDQNQRQCHGQAAQQKTAG